ncbi:MAG: prepilin-type N-terminal cleavage/methylation domain-containing protein [Zavarzinella sp.]|nr:prepilin-type N-terminal cleavage/methylation domain-containing protein [Zavarzinella sp.]
MRRSTTTGRRAGFTLVELIIVIGIIALLAGLLLQAVVKVKDAGQRTVTRNEIGQLGVGIENFKSTYQVTYVPTALILCSDYAAAAQANPTWAPALQDSQQYMSKVWPKANFANRPGPPNPPSPPNPFPPNTLITLDGNQVLVFLLGGIAPTDNRFTGGGWQGNRSGFLNSPINPFNLFNGVAYEPALIPSAQPPATWARDPARPKGPFYDFKPEQINSDAHVLDPYKYPYYYFSSKIGNDYNFFGIYQPALNPTNNPLGFNTRAGYGGVPANSPLPSGGTSPPVDVPPMHPFVGLDGKFINANGFQIISAGKNNLPGPGGWDTVNNVPLRYEAGIGEYNPGGRGGDDQSNFARGILSGD